ncbi:MAG: dynamin family protein, partial [Eubacteriales bacterium]|nr:dynamin family protein [Eubacteriales bacterium]
MGSNSSIIGIINELYNMPGVGFLFDTEQIELYNIINRKLGNHDDCRPFCVAFCGVFSSGKTSLINELLSDALPHTLPVGINPVTKMVIRIRYATVFCCSYYKGGICYNLSVTQLDD